MTLAPAEPLLAALQPQPPIIGGRRGGPSAPSTRNTPSPPAEPLLAALQPQPPIIGGGAMPPVSVRARASIALPSTFASRAPTSRTPISSAPPSDSVMPASIAP